MMVSYGRRREARMIEPGASSVRKWIICSGAIESAALASSHGEGVRGAKLGKKTLGQSAARVSQNWI